MKLAVLYSGGKDSNYALYLAAQQHDIECLITMESYDPHSYMFQSIGNNLVELQAKALKLPLLKYQTYGVKEEELQDLQNALIQAKKEYQIEGVVTGAIKSAYQSSRIQKICNLLDLECFNPLWQIDEDEFMDTLLEENFDIRLFGIFSYPFTKELLGKKIDSELITRLRELRTQFGISVSGEGGEFESFVVDSPLFEKKIELGKVTTQMDGENSGVLLVEENQVRLVEK